jgi:hypothetical protein
MGYLPYGGRVMVSMYESLVELPPLIVMGRIPGLEHMLSGAHGLLPYLHWVMSALVPKATVLAKLI